jgi:energy-coupling factor transport system ATP-binding protein
LELRVENLDYVYNGGTPLEKRALEGIHFTLPGARVLGILGGTGSGKTTLIRHFNGLLTPTGGRVFVGGTDTRFSGPQLRHKVGLVFQRPERQLFEETVYGDISFVLRRFSGLEDGEIRDRVYAACAQVGLNIDVTADRSPTAMSEGERRKTAIAGILVNEPEVLVLDEPLVGLDPPSIRDLVNVLAKLKKAGDRTLVIVSHDVDDFLPLLDFLLVLDKGRQAAYGTVMDVCASLGDNTALRCLLPSLALLVHDLDKAGHPLVVDSFEITTMAEQLTNLLVRNGGAG